MTSRLNLAELKRKGKRICVIVNSQFEQTLVKALAINQRDASRLVIFQPYTKKRLQSIKNVLEVFGPGCVPVFFVQGRFGNRVIAQGLLETLEFNETLSTAVKRALKKFAIDEYIYARNLVGTSHLHMLKPQFLLQNFRKLSDNKKLLPGRWPATICFLPSRFQFEGQIDDELSKGAVREVSLELRQRNAELRRCAIQKYGTSCMVCGFDFQQTYGPLGEGFIIVHHLKPVSKAGRGGRKVTVRDVAVVCANCHCMLHRRGTNPMSISELKRIIRTNRGCRNMQ